MSSLTEWVTNIILFILLATVIDMLIPNSSMQKYTKLVTGLLLMAIIMTPLFKILSKDFEANFLTISQIDPSGEKNIKNSIEVKKKEIQANEQAYILEQIAVRLKKDTAKELMKRYGFEVETVKLYIDKNSQQTFPDNLQKVSVSLKQTGNRAGTVETIKQVEINIKEPQTSQKQDDQIKEIAGFLSQKWNVQESRIQVLIEGGTSQING